MSKKSAVIKLQLSGLEETISENTVLARSCFPLYYLKVFIIFNLKAHIKYAIFNSSNRLYDLA